MAPRNSSPSHPAAPPALCRARPPSGAEEYICNFCPRGFRSGNGLAGHYNKHKDVEHDLWIMLGPKGSKIRKDIIQARYEGKTYEYKKRVWPARGKGKGKARARTPEPIRATQPQSASPGPQARVVGQVVRVQGRGGLLVVKNQRADFFLNNPRARLQEAGPAAKIPGPVGLLVRRDFVALSDGGSARWARWFGAKGPELPLHPTAELELLTPRRVTGPASWNRISQLLASSDQLGRK